MCCIVALFAWISPRLAIFMLWLFDEHRMSAAFEQRLGRPARVLPAAVDDARLGRLLRTRRRGPGLRVVHRGLRLRGRHRLLHRWAPGPARPPGPTLDDPTGAAAAPIRSERVTSLAAWRAIMRSSSVATTTTGAPGVRSCRRARVRRGVPPGSTSMPRKSSPAQISSRISGACSPMPPVNTSVSRPPSTRGVGADLLADRAAEHPDGQVGPSVAVAPGRQQRPHVRRRAGQPEQARLVVHEVLEGRRRRSPRSLSRCTSRPGSRSPDAGAHDDAAGRGEPHRRVDRAPVATAHRLAPLPEVGDHGPAERLGTDVLDDVLVGQAVEAVAAHPVVARTARGSGRWAASSGACDGTTCRSTPPGARRRARAPDRFDARRWRPVGAAGRAGRAPRSSAISGVVDHRRSRCGRCRRGRPGGRRRRAGTSPAAASECSTPRSGSASLAGPPPELPLVAVPDRGRRTGPSTTYSARPSATTSRR